LWKKTETWWRKVLIESGINYVEVPTEAAFYGPKIDVQVWSAIGREFTIATTRWTSPCPPSSASLRRQGQLEQDAGCASIAPARPHERFIGFLIEHIRRQLPALARAGSGARHHAERHEALINYAKPIVAEPACEHGARGCRISARRRQRRRISNADNCASTRCWSSAAATWAGAGERASPPRRTARREAEGGSRGVVDQRFVVVTA